MFLIAILERAYNAFAKLYGHHQRGGFFVVREKDGMKADVVRRAAKKNLPKDIISDETIVLTGDRTRNEYPERMRRRRSPSCTRRSGRSSSYSRN